jgi:hypothetical protein
MLPVASLVLSSQVDRANHIIREDIMPQNQPFEIPQQLRELAERNVEQARTAYGQLMDAMAQATGM